MTTKRIAGCVALALLSTSLMVFGTAKEVRAGGNTDALTIQVSGSPLGSITSNPLDLSPAFAPTITDYVLRCEAGTNTIQLTLSAVSGRTITVGASRGPSVAVQETLVENQAIIVSALDLTNPRKAPLQYWIRCLPHDFPQLSVTKPGSPPPGWYLTGNTSFASTSGYYAMVLDANGTPVWYRKPAGSQALNVTPLNDGTIAWKSTAGPYFGAFEDYNLNTQTTRWLTPSVPPTDFHELEPMTNGDLMMLSNPLRSNVDVTALGGGSSATIVDCVLEEMDPNGHLVWQWRASDHISVGESTHPSGPQWAYDIFHCNSSDTDPVKGNVLLSARHTDAVFLINKTTGAIIWKMGGTSFNHDHGQILTITGDPQGAFHAQHDARFEPNGDISLYDNQTWDATLAARGVEYHISTAAGTAALVWSYQSPDGKNSPATGTFRRMNNGTDNVIGWGFKPNTLFTEVDAAGTVMLNVAFPSNQYAYRVVKVASVALDHSLLRATAGLPSAPFPSVPDVAFVGPASGPAQGGATANVTGTGFLGATAVSFGPNPAPAFSVNNDTSITATVPAGTGVVDVVVTGPGGTSSVEPGDELVADSSFESGTGSWIASARASISVSSAYARSGTYSLQVSPRRDGPVSAITGRYAVPSGAQVTAGAWILTPLRSARVQAMLTFYDSTGSKLASDPGPLVASSNGNWTQVSETAIAPLGAASVAVGVLDRSASRPIYIDDASLLESPRYVYGPLVTGLLWPPLDGREFSGPVATFVEGYPAPPASDFSTTISWGDGTTSAGRVVANSSGGFSVTGRHTYAEGGSQLVTVRVTDSGGSVGTANTTLQVHEVDSENAQTGQQGPSRGGRLD